MVGVEEQREAVGLGVLVVAGGELARNPGRLAIEQPDADIQRRLVVGDAQLGGFRDGLFLGIALGEAGAGPQPDFVVEAAVDRGAACARTAFSVGTGPCVRLAPPRAGEKKTSNASAISSTAGRSIELLDGIGAIPDVYGRTANLRFASVVTAPFAWGRASDLHIAA